MKNINVELFKRYAPKKKIEMVKSLSRGELLNTKKETIIRILKEAGDKKKNSRNSSLRISRNLRVGNNWNSDIEEVSLYKGKLYLWAYVQMDHTDTNKEVDYDKFFRSGEFRGTAYETNRYGDKYPHYFVYDDDDKANVLKSFLLEYIYTKYKDKLKN